LFAYYVELAGRSLRRSPGLTALMMLAIGVGVASSMTMYAVFRGMAADPIPQKSSRLFAPLIDSWGPGFRRPREEPPLDLTYIDAMALLAQHRGALQAAIYPTEQAVYPSQPQQGGGAMSLRGYAVTSEFFPMLELPFHYGSGWATAGRGGDAAVVVISDHLNQLLFGGGNNLGRIVHIGDHDYRVVGVVRTWNPQPEFFADYGYPLEPADFFIPLQYAVTNQALTDVDSNCKRDADNPGLDIAALLRSDCTWLSYMVELDDAAAVQRYRAYLDGYATQQQQLGRFAWAPNNRLRDVMDMLDHERVVPDDARVSLLVAQGLLLVCLVNTIGLLLAKFLRRSGEIAIRRALGASRRAIYAQFLVEAGVIGLGGGVLGLVLTGLGVMSVGLVMSAWEVVNAHFDGQLFGFTLALAVVATVLAGVYPSYRAMRIPPGLQLKVQ
jgi:putative ABC transport system permease protein